MAVLKKENVERIVTDKEKMKKLIAEGYEVLLEEAEEPKEKKCGKKVVKGADVDD